MTLSQPAIVPEAGPFGLFTQIKIMAKADLVLEQLKQLPQLVDEINQHQPEANLALSIAFTQQFWGLTNRPMPDDLIPFTPLGKGEITAPSSDVDVLIHCHSNRHDLHFYLLRKFLSEVADAVQIVDETYGYRYLDARDMTEFIDGTENPAGEQRQTVAIIPDGPFAGGSYVLAQRFVHDLPAWHRLSVTQQEKIIGRTKPDSIELDDVPSGSHVGRVDIKEQGTGLKIVRHSLPYGSVSGDHGLLFIAYCNRVHNLQEMLASMYGERDGKTDLMLNFTRAVTGAYFFAPSVEMLRELTIA
jgi:putative iron-dependent peroxidase